MEAFDAISSRSSPAVPSLWAYAWGGCSYLIPFHALLLQVDYFSLINPLVKAPFLITVCYMVPVTFGVIVMCFFLEALSARTRVLLSYGGFTIALLAFVVADFVGWQGSLLLFVLLSGLVGAADAVAQSTWTSHAAECSPAALRAVLFGNAIAGVVGAATKLVVRVAIPGQAIRISALIFFVIAALQSAVTPIIWERKVHHHGEYAGKPNASLLHGRDQVEGGQGQGGGGGQDSLSNGPVSSLRVTLSLLWMHCLLLVVVFFVTLLFYPGIASSFASSFMDPTWVPLLMLSSFNLGDFVGRMMCLVFERISLWLGSHFAVNAFLCVSRLGFGPLFVLSLPSVSLITTEFFPLAALFFFGATGGLLGSANASIGTSISGTPRAGVVLTLSILLGLLLGSLVSLIFAAFFLD